MSSSSTESNNSNVMALSAILHNPSARIPADVVLRACREIYAGEDELAGLVKSHHGYCTARRLTNAAYGEEVGMDPLTVVRVWIGQATEEQQTEFRAKVGPFMAALAKANRINFANTEIAKQVWEALDVAKRRSARGKGVLVWIQGDAGIGKTTVARAWAAENNHGSSCFYEPKGAGGLKALICDLAEARGVDSTRNYQRTLQKLFGSFEPGIVLIVDEAHLLVSDDPHSAKQPKLDMLRRLSDITGCAVVFLDTDEQVEAGLRNSRYNDKQLWRRMARIVDLPRSLGEADLRALFEFRFPKMTFDDALAAVFREVNEHPKGGFGQVGILFDDAIDFALDNKRHTPTRKDLLVCAEQKLARLERIHASTRKGGLRA